MNKSEKDLIREARNAYKREWRAKNRERIKKYNDAYWLRKAMAAKSGEGKADDAK